MWGWTHVESDMCAVLPLDNGTRIAYTSTSGIRARRQRTGHDRQGGGAPRPEVGKRDLERFPFPLIARSKKEVVGQTAGTQGPGEPHSRGEDDG